MCSDVCHPLVLEKDTRLLWYSIVSVLGRGGFGITYVARDTNLDRLVAIKEYFPTEFCYRGDEGSILSSNHNDTELYAWGLSSFITEAKTLASFSHPNICRVYSVFEENNSAYMVMDLEQGTTLTPQLNLSQAELLNGLIPVMDGLQQVHDAGFIHRDIKPSNLLIRHDNSVVLLDFGSARQIVSTHSSEMTTLVSVGYSPYEQYGSDSTAQGPWTDIYSFGALLYEMVTKEPPIDSIRRASNILSGKPDPYVSVAQNTDNQFTKDFLDAIDIALAFKPADRPQSMSAWIDILETPADLLTSAAMPTQDINSRTSNTALTKNGSITQTYEIQGSQNRPSVIARLKNLFSNQRKSSRKSIHPDKQDDLDDPFRPQPDLADNTGIKDTEGGWADEFRTTDTEVEVTKLITSGASRLVPSDTRQDYTGIGDHTQIIKISEPTKKVAKPGVVVTVVASADPSKTGMKLDLHNHPLQIGRSASVDVKINDPGLSRVHAIVDIKDGAVLITDKSSNGIYINGQRISRDVEKRLKFGDAIHLGSDTKLTISPTDLQSIPDLTGKLVDGRYSIQSTIHATPKSSLFIAQDTRLPKQVSLKLLSPEFAAYPGYLERFQQEALAASTLNHTNICKVLDHGVTDLVIAGTAKKLHFLCMDYMPGGSVADKLKSDGHMTLDSVIKFTTTVAEALEYAHHQNIVHGGIKPSCIVFDQLGNSFLADFSVSGYSKDPIAELVVGTPAYIAPEQWDGDQPTAYSDQFALSCVAYFALAGIRPFEGQDNPTVRRRNFERGAVPLHIEAKQRLGLDYSKTLSEVLAKAMSIDTATRYPSITQFSDAIANACNEEKGSGMSAKRIFLSYNRLASSGWAQNIADKLESLHSLSVFVDTRRNESGKRISAYIADEIHKADVFICLLGQGTLDSEWVGQEILIAFQSNKPMIPIFQDDFDEGTHGNVNTEHIEALLDCDGVPLLNRRGAFYDASIEELAKLIKISSMASEDV